MLTRALHLAGSPASIVSPRCRKSLATTTAASGLTTAAVSSTVLVGEVTQRSSTAGEVLDAAAPVVVDRRRAPLRPPPVRCVRCTLDRSSPQVGPPCAITAEDVRERDVVVVLTHHGVGPHLVSGPRGRGLPDRR